MDVGAGSGSGSSSGGDVDAVPPKRVIRRKPKADMRSVVLAAGWKEVSPGRWHKAGRPHCHKDVSLFTAYREVQAHRPAIVRRAKKTETLEEMKARLRTLQRWT